MRSLLAGVFVAAALGLSVAAPLPPAGAAPGARKPTTTVPPVTNPPTTAGTTPTTRPTSPTTTTRPVPRATTTTVARKGLAPPGVTTTVATTTTSTTPLAAAVTVPATLPGPPTTPLQTVPKGGQINLDLAWLSAAAFALVLFFVSTQIVLTRPARRHGWTL
jgi:hypothetical protein